LIGIRCLQTHRRRQDEAEYYAVGQDNAKSLFDEALEKSTSIEDQLSFLYCGSGDARNFFATLADIPFTAKGSHGKSLHFTILDLKPAALARTVIILDMLQRYGFMKLLKTPGCDDALVVIAYLYSCTVIPPFVNDKLQEHITHLLPVLETDDEPVSNWLFIPSKARRQIAYVLKQWQQPMEGVYRPSNIRSVVRMKLDLGEAQRRSIGFTPDRRHVKGFESDQKVFDELTVLLPLKDFADRREPELSPLMATYQSRQKNAAQLLSDYINETWKTNATLIDMDYEKTRQPDWSGPPELAPDESKAPPLDVDPLEVMGSLPHMPESLPGAISRIGDFFSVVALGTVKAVETMKVEVVIGEMADVMERIRYDCLESRATPTGGIDPANFPRIYDRIHMSNIP
jgi:Domain of unknown function (DUF4470)